MVLGFSIWDGFRLFFPYLSLDNCAQALVEYILSCFVFINFSDLKASGLAITEFFRRTDRQTLFSSIIDKISFIAH